MAPGKKPAALAQYLAGVSHNFIANWAKQAVFGKALKPRPVEKVAWVEADELWT